MDEESKERVKLAFKEQVQELAELVNFRAVEVQRAEDEVEKAKVELAKARKRLADTEIQLARAQSCLRSGGSFSISPRMNIKSDEGSDSLRVSLEKAKEVSIINKPAIMIPGSDGHSDVSMKLTLGKRSSDSRSALAAGHESGDVSNISKKGKTAINEGSGLLQDSHVKKEPGKRSSDPRSALAAGHESEDVSKISKKGKTAINEGSGLLQDSHVKKEPEPREGIDLIPLIRGSEDSRVLQMSPPNYVNGLHKRKPRTLCINPVAGQLCATSALDGLTQLWQIEGMGSNLKCLGSVDCLSINRRWPEDMVWHPNGDRLFACYAADGSDNQVAVIDTAEKMKVVVLKDKPHTRGVINNINFLPCGNASFVTGGCDHSVCLWKEKETDEGIKWKAKTLHRSQHTSAVMSVAGLRHKELVLSGGADKRIVVHDILYNRAHVCYTLESKVMGVLPNPKDFHLFMVQTGTAGQQLRLYDIRLQRTELHSFGWTQESSDCQSALINQTWSPDGYYIASGSTDPKVHIFDIRYNSNQPSQSIQMHQKRVFKAAWHHSFPLLISISSDLNIGLLRYGS